MVLPVFLLILLGMIDFGWYLKLNNDLARANSQGARIAAFSATDTEIRSAVVTAANDKLAVTGENVTISRESTVMTRGTFVEVESAATYHSVTGFSIVHILLNDKPITASATVRIE